MALKEKTSNTKGKVQKFTEEEISKIKQSKIQEII